MQLRPRRAVAGTILNHLAFADDIVLLAHSVDDVRALFLALEKLALSVGLRLNYGIGKTELMYWNVPGPPPVIESASGKTVTISSNYKYLGVNILDPSEEVRRRRGLAWGLMRQYRNMWRSPAPASIKRHILKTIVGPALTYGLEVFPLTCANRRTLRATFSNMLRCALDVRRSRNAKWQLHTHQLHEEMLLLPTQLLCWQLKHLGHVLREHFGPDSTVVHPCAQLFVWEPPFKRKSGGQRSTYVSQVCQHLRIGTPAEVVEASFSRDKWRNLVAEACVAEEKLQFKDLHLFTQPDATRRGVVELMVEAKVRGHCGVGFPPVRQPSNRTG
jgi:hypothetical protein